MESSHLVDRHLVIVLDGWPARALSGTVTALDLTHQVLASWETLRFFTDDAGEP